MKYSCNHEKLPQTYGLFLEQKLIGIYQFTLIRSAERNNGIPADSAWQQIMDEHFDDEQLEKIYPNMININ